MTENHFRSHFSPFKYTTFLSNLFQNGRQRPFWKSKFAPKTIGFFHYVLSMAMPNMKLIGEFMTELEMPQAFWTFLCKMAARGHFVFPIDAKNHRVLVIWDLNGYGEYEFWYVYLWQSYGLYKRWRAAAETAAQPETRNIISPKFSNFGDIINQLTKIYLPQCLWVLAIASISKYK